MCLCIYVNVCMESVQMCREEMHMDDCMLFVVSTVNECENVSVCFYKCNTENTYGHCEYSMCVFMVQ